MKRRLIALYLLAVVAFFLAAPSAARADIAPPPPPAGADIQPAQGTQVRMMEETVVIEAQPNTYGQPTRATVEASFTMRNLGAQEERMQVRFPLNVLYPQYQGDLNTCVYPAAFPEINDFRAQVDGKAAPVTYTINRLRDEMRNRPDKDVRCWANFAVTFPPAQDVNVIVRYSVEGYLAWDTPGMVEFRYVLITGRDWKDSIGRAEIIFRAPFALDEQNLMAAYPDGGQVQGNELRWVFEDFEPEDNPAATIINPGLRERIQREQDALAKNPADGEAWGRLGRWYKEAIRLRRGFRWDAGGLEMYALSKAAYEKSVSLLPKDADWHAGFAELLCLNAEYDGIGGRTQRRDDLVRCVDEVRRSLAINPRQALARELLELFRWHQPPFLSEQGSAIDFLVLTTTPTAQPEDIDLPELEATPTLASTPTVAPPAPTSTPPAPTPVIIAQADLTRTAEAAAPTVAPTGDGSPAPTPSKSRPTTPGLCGAALLPVVIVAWKRRDRKSRKRDSSRVAVSFQRRR